MKKGIVALAAAAVLAVPVATASAQSIVRVADPTPTATFTDAQGNQGFVEVRDDGVRACNENEAATPAEDQLTGYAWIDAGGDGFAGNADDDGTNGPTYGNGTIGAGDYDGEGVDDGDDLNGTEGDDCPSGSAP